MKKTLLIVPPRTILKSSIKRCCTPIGLAYIAAVLEQNKVDVRILDCYAEGYENEKELEDGYVRVGLDDKDIMHRIMVYKPDYVGVTCGFTSEIGNTMYICKLVKKVSNATIVVGGLHPSNYSKETLDACPEIDVLIKGEGEYRMLNLVEGKDYNSLGRIEDVNSIPFPARHLLKMDIYLKINRHISLDVCRFFNFYLWI